MPEPSPYIFDPVTAEEEVVGRMTVVSLLNDADISPRRQQIILRGVFEDMTLAAAGRDMGIARSTAAAAYSEGMNRLESYLWRHPEALEELMFDH